jgi:hypothetical protein
MEHTPHTHTCRDEFDDDGNDSDLASEASRGSAILFMQDELDSAALLERELDWLDYVVVVRAPAGGPTVCVVVLYHSTECVSVCPVSVRMWNLSSTCARARVMSGRFSVWAYLVPVATSCCFLIVRTRIQLENVCSPCDKLCVHC